jgi:hypothetical protein
MGKPFAGQPGGGFGQGQQGGGMGAFQGFMRQMQPQGGGFGQRPQPQMAGAPPQNLGGFGQRPPPQMAGAPPQMPPQNLIGMLQGIGNNLGPTGQPLGEEGFGPAGSRPVSGMSQGVGLPTPQPQGMDAAMGFLANRQPQQAPQFGGPQQSQMMGAPQQQNLDQVLANFMRQQELQQQQTPQTPQSLLDASLSGQQPQVSGGPRVFREPRPMVNGGPVPQPMVSFPPQQLQSMMGAMRFSDGGAVAEDPRMQAMRSIQQLANRQRGY